MSSGAVITRPTIPPNWRRWPPATDGTHYSTACPYQTRVSRSRIVLHMALVQQKSAPAAAAIDGENALLIQPIAMHHVANRDHLMTFPGRHIRSEEPSAQSVVLRSPNSMKPAVVDIAGLINIHPLSSFQKGIMVLIGGVIVMDGFDVQAIGFVAPALTQDWHIDPTALGPIFGAGLLGMLLGSMLLSILADRVGRRPVLVGSTIFFSLCMLGTAAAESVQQLVFLRFLTGLGIGGVMANAVALASEYSPQRQRASLLMWISCGFTGGAIAGGVISAALIPWGGWRSVFLVGGVLPLAIAAMMYWRLPESLLFLLLQHKDHEKLRQLLRRIAPGIDPGGDLYLATPVQVHGRGSFTKI